MDFSIRKLSAADHALAKELFIFFQVDDGDPVVHIPQDEYLERLLSRDDFHVLVATGEGKLIGGLTAYELPMYKEAVNEIFLYEIGVDPLYRQRGVATELIEELKRICSAKGIGEFYVGAISDNTPAVNLYARTGGKREDVAWFVYELE